jgi:hypothetical protein
MNIVPSFQDETITIDNASWWMNHSIVVIREDMLAEDSEWIGNQATRVVNAGTQFARIESSLGSANILLVKRMVVSGVVAVQRLNGRVKTVNLPQDAGKLLSQDLDYIAEQINKYNAPSAPMTEAQQQDFLPSANGQSETTLPTTN